MTPTRWGIASAGKISADFVNSLSLHPTENHQVVAVAARSLDRAKSFAEEWNIPTAYGSYKELAEDPIVDIAYVSTIHPYHFELCKLFLGAGKNVLCEKPLTTHAAQTKELIDMAREKNVFFQEGYWSRFFPVYDKLREALASGAIGDIKVVQSSIGLPFDVETMGGGTLIGLGCYGIMFAQLIYQEFPQKIVASGILHEKGIDSAVFTTLHYSGDRVAYASTHDGVWLSNTAEIYGTKGSIVIPNFWCPESITINSEKHEFPLPTPKKPINYLNCQGLVYEPESIRHCLLEGQKENPLMTLQETLWIAQIIDEINKQIGVSYN